MFDAPKRAPSAPPLVAAQTDGLRAQYWQLDAERVSLIGPVSMTCAGSTLIVGSLVWNLVVFVGTARPFDLLPAPPWAQAFSAVALSMVAPAVLMWGIRQIQAARAQRSELTDRMDAIETALDGPP